jgi:hypothetical protein
MKRLALVASLALFAGCFVRATPYSSYQSGPSGGERSEVYYYGNHFIPDSAGGGWCYIDGPHQHDYFPERDDYYDYDQGYYWYRGPFLFAFFGGHPFPGGSWCFVNGPHQHDYHPPAGSDWRWNRTGYVYQGSFRPERPPPASYWARPAPRQDWRSNRPTVRPAPAPARRPSRDAVRPAPAPVPDRGVRPEPRAADDDKAKRDKKEKQEKERKDSRERKDDDDDRGDQRSAPRRR